MEFFDILPKATTSPRGSENTSVIIKICILTNIPSASLAIITLSSISIPAAPSASFSYFPSSASPLGRTESFYDCCSLISHTLQQSFLPSLFSPLNSSAFITFIFRLRSHHGRTICQKSLPWYRLPPSPPELPVPCREALHFPS